MKCEVCGRKRGTYAEAAETLAPDSDDFRLCPEAGMGSCYRLGYERAQAKLEQAERENIRLRQLLFIGLHLTEDTRDYADGTTRLAHAHDVVFPGELFTDPSADCLGAWQSHVGAALRASGKTAIVTEPARWKCSLCGVSGPKTLGAMNEHLLSCAKRPPTAVESALAAAQGALRRGREELDAAIEGLCAHSQPMVPRSAIEQWLFPIQAALAAESGKSGGEARESRIRALYAERATLTQARRLGSISADGTARLAELEKRINDEEAAEVASAEPRAAPPALPAELSGKVAEPGEAKKEEG